jgi:hypothetical protein
MTRAILIGIAAGLTGALLFASMASGSLLSFFLFYLAPLPLMIASLGWSHAAGLIAAVVASGSLAAAFGTWFFFGFLVGIGVPACWLAYLALLARPVPPAAVEPGRSPVDPHRVGAPQTLEWFPVGRLVVWSAILGAAIVALAIPSFGTDSASFRAALKTAIEHLLRADSEVGVESPVVLPGFSDRGEQLDFLVAVIPPAAAVVSTVTSLFNLWLAARIVKISGRLKRPWPDLSATQLPRFALLLLGLGVAGSFLPYMSGIVGGLFACTMLMAYALLGLVVLHQTTLGFSGRSFVLAGVYALIIVFAWPILLVALIGLADGAFDLRRRLARNRGPSNTST